MLTVISRGSGGPSERSEGPYTGEIWREVLHRKKGTTVGKNFFTPCARTHWHSHEGGQVLVVESGEGYVADEDGVTRISVGDIIWTPPGVRHWHGGAHEHSLLHIAISFGEVAWQEKVTDEQYESARKADWSATPTG